MGRPKPNSTEPNMTGPTTDAAPAPYPTMENHQSEAPPLYPPAAVPYPPPQAASPHQASVVDGTPVVSFPPAGHAFTPQHNTAGGGSQFPQHIGDPWSTGLFDCNLNETNAVMTASFPCVTFGQIAEMLDEGQTRCTLGSFMYILMVPALCTCWIIGSNYRRKLRQKYNLVEAPYEDWAAHLFCPCCALCQEYRELEKRGLDPSSGWMGHLARQRQQQTQMSPPMEQFMNK